MKLMWNGFYRPKPPSDTKLGQEAVIGTFGPWEDQRQSERMEVIFCGGDTVGRSAIDQNGLLSRLLLVVRL